MFVWLKEVGVVDKTSIVVLVFSLVFTGKNLIFFSLWGIQF